MSIRRQGEMARKADLGFKPKETLEQPAHRVFVKNDGQDVTQIETYVFRNVFFISYD